MLTASSPLMGQELAKFVYLLMATSREILSLSMRG